MYGADAAKGVVDWRERCKEVERERDRLRNQLRTFGERLKSLDVKLEQAERERESLDQERVIREAYVTEVERELDELRKVLTRYAAHENWEGMTRRRIFVQCEINGWELAEQALESEGEDGETT